VTQEQLALASLRAGLVNFPSLRSNPPAQGLMPTLLRSVRSDLHTYNVPATGLRLLRTLRALRSPAKAHELLNNSAYRAHAAFLSITDPFAFIAHRHYLARGLDAQQRLDAALTHYRAEATLPQLTYRDPVYRSGGLPLWHDERDGVEYSLRLQPGNDVLYEGALTVVFYVGEARTCVLSYVNVDPALFGKRAGRGLAPFVVRRHANGDHGYQKAFNDAFDRTTPGHLCMAALEGIALAQKRDALYGIAAAAHPSMKPGREKSFQTAYDEFWESISGEQAGLAYRVSLPVALSDTKDMVAKARKRALARRAHMEAVRVSAQQAMQRALGTAAPQPAPVEFAVPRHHQTQGLRIVASVS
jgi:uncharacterized protein VirK/YbjX